MPPKQNEKGEVPVQAWVPAEHVAIFRRRYRHRGAISQLVRNAFRMAIEEDEQTERAAQEAVERTLG